MDLRHIQLGASLSMHVNVGYCTGLMGPEPGFLWILNPTWLPPEGCRISKGRAQGLMCSLLLAAYPCTSFLPWPDSPQLLGIHRKHLVYLESRSAVEAGQITIFRDVVRTRI